ncbi:hypothetical protein [Streptomyces sp. DH12]|uniref:hypothetical protein n=1 Tax=Streptomyces sp. DH12 TaxID=2857010 RepID=UPI001E5C4FE8|nr:hypothetical protein [Streptomyces sp. DH12]
MFKKHRDRRTTARRHAIAMAAARAAQAKAVIHGDGTATTDDVVNLAYGSHAIRLTDDEARDALAAELATVGRRLETSA